MVNALRLQFMESSAAEDGGHGLGVPPDTEEAMHMFKQINVLTIWCVCGYMLAVLLCGCVAVEAGPIVYEVREPLGCKTARWSTDSSTGSTRP